MMSERDLQKAVVDFMQYHGWRAIRMNSGMRPTTRKGKASMMRFGERGMPDYLFLYYLPRGRAKVLWVEFKRRGMAASDFQKLWQTKEGVTSRKLAIVHLVDDFDGFRAWYDSYALYNEDLRPQEVTR